MGVGGPVTHTLEFPAHYDHRREAASSNWHGDSMQTSPANAMSTVADPANPVPEDLLKRDFTASAPNQRWMADFTEIATWAGVVYAAFVIDCYSRMIVGWRMTSHMCTDLPLDALQMAVHQRKVHKGQTIHHSDHGPISVYPLHSNACRRRTAVLGRRGR